MRKTLNLTMIFCARDFSNRWRWKKADGNTYAYIPGRIIGYSLAGICDWNTPFVINNGVKQFDNEAGIDKYPKLDLFGYYKKNKNGNVERRNAVVKITNAISLIPISPATSFLACLRRGYLMYTYTVSIDLERVGKEDDGSIEISNEEKENRVCDLLDAILELYGIIEDRLENINPIFLIGGIYNSGIPFFMNSVQLNNKVLDCDRIRKTMNLTKDLSENSKIAALSIFFRNEEEIDDLCNMDIREAFECLKAEVREYYQIYYD